MAINKQAQDYMNKLLPKGAVGLEQTDPEFAERFANFAFDEVVNQDDLDDRTRWMSILATLLGCQGTAAFQALLPGALKAGVTPVAVKEIVYQAVAYLGMGRVLPFFQLTNQVFTQQGIKLPLASQATTTADDRLTAGETAQMKIFGEGMKGFWKMGPRPTRHINYWLTANCFGDYYTRQGLTLAEREMITFCFLAAQGGVEPQLKAHAKANMQIGNSKAFLIKVISQNIPYIGYPRSLNALRCVNKAADEMND